MKKLLLFPTLILISMGALAQLSVRPVPSGADSFIYVDNQILYVQEAITLAPNNTTNQEASIYLRNGAQLIQGGKSTNEMSNNEGQGFLSVQRAVPNTNYSAYNDWASPVGNPAVAVETSRGKNKNFGINSVYEPMPGALNARIAANIPGYDGILSPLTISTRWLYTVETPGTEAEAAYRRFNTDNYVKPGFGYTMKGVGPVGTSVNYEFRGRPNSGDFTVPIAGNTAPGPNGEIGKMVLSGNPYPSALDLNQVFHDLDNLQLLQFWFYDEDRTLATHLYRTKPFGYGTWVPGPADSTTDKNTNSPAGIYTRAAFSIWNSAGEGTGTGNFGANDQNKRYAPIGQGFRLVGVLTAPEGSTVTIKNKHRIFVKEGAATGSVFQRPENSDNSYSTETTEANRAAPIPIDPVQINNGPQLLRLYVVFDNAITRDMVLSFSREATDGFDRGYDGSSPGGLKSDAYFPIEIDGERKPFVINGTNYSPEKRIPISFKLHTPGRIKILVPEEINKPYGNVYLYDHKEDTYLELSSDNHDGVAFGLPAGKYDDRYYLVFQKDDVETLPWPKADFEQFKSNVGLFQNNPVQRLEVRNPENYNIKSINVYDMSGKLVINETNLGDNNTYSFYTGHLSDGVYLVKLLTIDDMPIDYKAIILNK